MPASTSRPKPPFGGIVDEFRNGKVVPFLGAAASLRVVNAHSSGLPSAADLARDIALDAEFPSQNRHDLQDLAKIASYYVDVLNRDALRNKLRKVFIRPGKTFSAVHEVLATLANNNLLTITTNYDVMLENAFRAAGKPFDVIMYPADNSEYANCMLRWRSGADEPEKLRPNELDIEDLENRNVIYKMHGSVQLHTDRWDGFVITEEDYVSFLSRMKNAVPGALLTFLKQREFLFLGYGLKDWNTRVLLRQVCKSERRSWAIQLNPSPFEETLWDRRNVGIFPMDLETFVQHLRIAITGQHPPARRAGAGR